MTDHVDTMRAIAERAVNAGADVVRAHSTDAGTIITKGHGDYVTAVDHAAEAAILSALHAATPDIPVVAEESGGHRADRYWVVDPVDGTTNFLRAFPIVGVTVALMVEGQPAVAVTAAPLLGSSWSAVAGRGAFDHNGRRLTVSEQPGRGVVSTGLPFRKPENHARYLAVFAAAFNEFEDLRRPGAASLDLAYTATGAWDGFFELGLSEWDIAAGALLVREAGGIVTDWTGDDRKVFHNGDIIAGTRKFHAQLMDIIGRTTA